MFFLVCLTVFGLAAESALRLTGCSDFLASFICGEPRKQQYRINRLANSQIVVNKDDDEKYMVQNMFCLSMGLWITHYESQDERTYKYI